VKDFTLISAKRRKVETDDGVMDVEVHFFLLTSFFV